MVEEINLRDGLKQFVIECEKTFNHQTSLDLFTLNLIKQLSRSVSSSALNYAEATGSGSDRDYANKVRIAYKEMRETKQNLEILKSMILDNDSLDSDRLANVQRLIADSDRLAGILYSCCRKAESKFR